MNIKNADFETIVMLGTLDDLIKKMDEEKVTFDQLKSYRGYDDLSLLSIAIGVPNFGIANLLLDENFAINIIGKPKINELGYLSYYINSKEALALAYRLLSCGIDLNQQDKRYGNTTLMFLCINSLRCQDHEHLDFLETCIVSRKGEGLFEKNKNKICALDIICQGYSPEFVFKIQNAIKHNYMVEYPKQS